MARRNVGIDEFDHFETDDDGRLFWKGKAIILEQRLTLKGIELALVGLGAAGALLAGIHPFLKSFGIVAN
jgi:hypothetical protein